MSTRTNIATSGICRMLLLPAIAVILFAPCAMSAALENAAGQRGPMRAPQPYLGIVFVDLNEDQNAALHVKGGVEIVLVDHDGPAGKVGLRPHDIIVRMNSQTVSNAEALRRMIHDAGEGTPVSLDVVRQNQSLTLSVQLADRDEVAREALKRMATTPDPLMDDPMPPMTMGGQGFMEQTAPVPAKQSFLASMLRSTPFTGLAMDEMEPQLGAFFGAPQGVGLLINTVLPSSPAAIAGLKAGDILLKADAMSLRSVADWTRYLHATRGRAITLTVLRDRQSQVVTLLPELKKHSMVEWPRFF